MKKLACLTIVLLFSLSAVFADEPVRYTSDTFARLSYINGHVYIQRATELDYEEGMLNMPVTEGDRMGTTEGRAEIYLGRGKYLRLDRNTKMDVLNLPNPANDLTRIQIWRGNIFFSIMSLKKEKAIEIHTDDASLYLLEAGLYRIDVRGEETEIFVLRGLLEAAGETGSVLIREAQRIEAVNGYFLGQPSGFMAVVEDSFDRWNEGRDLEVRKRMARRYLPAELEDFEYELAYHGEWTYVFPYGHVWIPGGITTDWRPYWNGRWVWLPVCGWTWLPYEPWGWATFHYGRWHWNAGFGWYWIPTTVWGPGWVHWYSGYDYIGWAPAGYWGRPGVIIDSIYYGRNTGNSYRQGSRVLTVIHKDQLKARNISKVALSQNSVKSIGQMSLVKTLPAVKQTNSSKIRLKSLRSDSSPTPKSTYTPSTKITNSDSSKRIKIKSPEIREKKEERNIPKTTTKIKSKKTSTTLGKITSVLSSKSSKGTSSKSSSSKSPSSNKIKSSSISKSKSSSSIKKSSSQKSSSRTRVSSKKVKKKK
ncbi:MAG: hypothetical protein JSV17_17070 [Candidatus Aminicenantes bacterium]|nr:MAG: hypothetical protein JSV17_17070 [Candidatus Aminicenantes bacterium]